MLLLSVINIFLRWGEMTLYWVEPLVRHLVFLSAFLGGVIATGRRNHIGIDILQRWLEGSENKMIQKLFYRVICLVSVITLAWLTDASITFVKDELEFGKAVFFGIHSGVLVGIIPFGFSLIGFRFLNLFIQSFGQQQAEEV